MSTVRYGMVIDTTRCFGCQTCVVGCKVCNEVPNDIYWSHLESLDGDTLYQATGTFPNVKLAFRPVLCNHCGNPECVAKCPTEAMRKSEETGIVSRDEDTCIGCGTCSEACPYSVPVIDEGTNVSSKCTFCQSRVTDKDPYCVESCPGKARYFGDLNDPSSEVSKIIAEKNAQPWMKEYGTDSSVYYV